MDNLSSFIDNIRKEKGNSFLINTLTSSGCERLVSLIQDNRISNNENNEITDIGNNQLLITFKNFNDLKEWILKYQSCINSRYEKKEFPFKWNSHIDWIQELWWKYHVKVSNYWEGLDIKLINDYLKSNILN